MLKDIISILSVGIRIGHTRVTYFDNRENNKEFWIAMGKGLCTISEGW
jgi:hypothetical protein